MRPVDLMADLSTVFLNGFRLLPLAASSSFVTALLHQYVAFNTFAETKTPAPTIRIFGHQLIGILSPPFLIDLATSIANPFVCTSAFGGGYYARKLYVCAMAFRIAYMMTWGQANRLRAVLHDTSKPDEELYSAMQAFVSLNSWRLWCITLPSWLLTAGATLAYISGL